MGDIVFFPDENQQLHKSYAIVPKGESQKIIK